LLIPVLLIFVWQISTSFKKPSEVFFYPPDVIPRTRLVTVYNNKLYYIWKTKIQNKELKFIVIPTNDQYATISPVKKNNFISALITRYNSKYDNMESVKEVISFKEKDLIKDHENTTYKLYYLKNKINNKFEIIGKKNIYYMPKNNILKIKKDYFGYVRIVKFVPDNYKSVIFDSLPDVSNDNLKHFSIIDILTKLFNKIPSFIIYLVNSIVSSLSIGLIGIFVGYISVFSVFFLLPKKDL